VVGTLLSFLQSSIKVLSERGNLLAIFNAVYFCSMFIAVLIAQTVRPPPLYPDKSLVSSFAPFEDDWLIMFAGIFMFNLVLSAFFVVTLSGIVFFPLSVVFLAYRAVLWGLLLYPLPSWLFLAVLPTLIIEGEAYVFAGVAGAVAGLSWVKPAWIFRGEELSRREALKTALKECMHLYKAVVLLLLVAATVETATIMCI
jgi:hypothetical protein